MTSKITAATAQSEFDQIMTRAVKHNDRFLVEGDGESAVLILSLADYYRTLAPPPDWLQESWEDAKRNGLDKLSMEEIDAEISASRRERRERQAQSGG